MLKSKERRIRITHIHPKDAYYPNKDQYIGLTGTFDLESSWYKGYYSGHFYPDSTGVFRSLYFVAVRYKRV